MWWQQLTLHIINKHTDSWVQKNALLDMQFIKNDEGQVKQPDSKTYL